MTNEVESQLDGAPFEPGPADLGGCGKPTVIGCLVILIVVAIGFVIFLFKARDMLDWALTQYEATVVANLSAEVTDEEKERLEVAFGRARAAIRENRIQPESAQRLQRFMSRPPRSDKLFGPDEVRELTEVLEGLDTGPVSRLREVRPESGWAGSPARHVFV